MKTQPVKIAIFIILIQISFSETIYIPTDYPTIQDGITASADFDTIMVSPGEYFENINFLGKQIVVASHFIENDDPGFIESTIINGGALASVVTFDSGETHFAHLLGFTITNGMGNDVVWEFTGGGITCKNGSSPLLKNLIVSDNNSLGGGGIYIQDSSPDIQYCKILNNNSESTAGGIYCWESNLTISYTEISYNFAGWLAGGLFGGSNSVLNVSNLTVIGNISNDLSGGGIYTNNSSAFIVNTIARENQPDEIASYNDLGMYALEIDYSNVLNGEDGVVPWLNVDFVWGSHNQQDHPLFDDMHLQDFHLLPESPCIDAGDPNSPLDPDESITDIGAYYFPQGIEGNPGDLNSDGQVNVLDIVRLVNIILGDPASDYELWAGDINMDGDLNVLDIVQIINIIIG